MLLDPKNVDWEKASDLVVAVLAAKGVPEAQVELIRREEANRGA